MLNIAAEVGEPAYDRIGETIDYRALVREAQKLSDEGHFELIETFICELGRRIVSHARVHAVDLELYKPGAIPPAMASVRYRVSKPSPSIDDWRWRSEEHTSELQSLMRISYAIFCLKTKNKNRPSNTHQ